MVYFQRLILSKLEEKMFKGKALILFGPRQVGKTTLVKELLARQSVPYLELNCDNPDIRALLSDTNESELKNLIGRNRIVFIDEAQRVKNIGLTIKILVDSFADVQVVASGSSALELANTINEPLTGRKHSFTLFPISLEEQFGQAINPLSFSRELNSLLVYGAYPEVLQKAGNDEKRELITELAGDALFKDIYTFQQIKNPMVLRTLLRALAYQIGSEVSSNELANTVGIDKKTVDSYIDILEKNYIIVRVGSFAKNLRNELKKSKKIYFTDLGIRNALINNFAPLANRNDVGALWENFCIIERIKFQGYHSLYMNNYFWRTYDGAEIDWIEEKDGILHAFEMKWNDKKTSSAPKSFQAAYKNSTWSVVTPGSVAILNSLTEEV